MSIVGSVVEATRSVGRPRCKETHGAILDAAADLLERLPYRDITIERIAAEAGVGKQTIYRWYNAKADLVLEAYLMRMVVNLDHSFSAPTDDAVHDISEHMHTLISILPTPIFASGYRALFAEAQLDLEFRRRFQEIILQRRRGLLRDDILRGIANGQFRSDLDPALVVATLFGTVLYHFLVTVEPPTAEFGDSIISMVLGGLLAKPAQSALAG